MKKTTPLVLSILRDVKLPFDFRHHVLSRKREETELVMGQYENVILYTGGRLQDCFGAIAEVVAMLQRRQNLRDRSPVAANIPLGTIEWSPWMEKAVRRVMAAWLPLDFIEILEIKVPASTVHLFSPAAQEKIQDAYSKLRHS